MSRDRRAGSDADADTEAALLTAYVDGVAELPPDERHRIEAWMAGEPGARADAASVQALLDRLRGLPPSYDGGN